jgi:hypothetical protein
VADSFHLLGTGRQPRAKAPRAGGEEVNEVLALRSWSLFGLPDTSPVSVIEFSFEPSCEEVWFAKTLADFEINDIAVLPPLFCYNS